MRPCPYGQGRALLNAGAARAGGPGEPYSAAASRAASASARFLSTTLTERMDAS